MSTLVFNDKKHEGGDPDEDRIPGFSSTNVADLRKGFHGCSRRVIQLILEAFLWVPKAQYLLFNSVYELEDQVYEKIRTEYTLPIYSIGPAIPFLFEFEENYVSKSISSPNGTRSYLEWLDSQSAGSVLYVSLGSYLSVSSEQMDEIAAGLTSSCVRLLWVARDETSRLKNSCGDQFKVLGHSSVGGFWTHCGFGCPLLTLPLHFIQHSNEKQIVENWKVGWSVREKREMKILLGEKKLPNLCKSSWIGKALRCRTSGKEQNNSERSVIKQSRKVDHLKQTWMFLSITFHKTIPLKLCKLHLY
ncbi:hypothetical protein LWI29_022664 [Acer saccharum]|uniref:Uncharacterized protein n=1 Tax=Acer saccharum TaxID=4024 RepID=A0AA39W096_ACESA|nr:hypothetical protein LWI29_022664 [Acer saccharum]